MLFYYYPKEFESPTGVVGTSRSVIHIDTFKDDRIIDLGLDQVPYYVYEKSDEMVVLDPEG